MVRVGILRLIRSQSRLITCSSAANNSSLGSRNSAAVMSQTRWASRVAKEEDGGVIAYDKMSPPSNVNKSVTPKEELGRVGIFRSQSRRISYISPLGSRNQNSGLGFGPAIMGQRRWASQVAAAEQDEDDSSGMIVYDYGKTMYKDKKMTEITSMSCGISIMLGTLIALTDTNYVVLKCVVASSLTCLNVIWNYLSQIVVHRIRWQPGADSFEVERISWTGQEIVTQKIRFKDIIGLMEGTGISFMIKEMPYAVGIAFPADLDKAFRARLEEYKVVH